MGKKGDSQLFNHGSKIIEFFFHLRGDPFQLTGIRKPVYKRCYFFETSRILAGILQLSLQADGQSFKIPGDLGELIQRYGSQKIRWKISAYFASEKSAFLLIDAKIFLPAALFF